jgi:hypothetical protein
MSVKFGFRGQLIGVLIAYGLAMAFPQRVVAAPLKVILLSAVLILSVRTLRPDPAWMRLTVATSVSLTIATVVTAIVGSDKTLAIVSEAATIVLVLAAGLVLIKALMRAGEVNTTTVYGVLCIYLLIALLFGSLYELFAIINPDFVHGGTDPVKSSDMLYYSIITLTTVGYGDITPATHLARSLASLEALIGQLYLVSIVAAVVSRYPGRSRGGGGTP